MILACSGNEPEAKARNALGRGPTPGVTALTGTEAVAAVATRRHRMGPEDEIPIRLGHSPERARCGYSRGHRNKPTFADRASGSRCGAPPVYWARNLPPDETMPMQFRPQLIVARLTQTIASEWKSDPAAARIV